MVWRSRVFCLFPPLHPHADHIYTVVICHLYSWYICTVERSTPGADYLSIATRFTSSSCCFYLFHLLTWTGLLGFLQSPYIYCRPMWSLRKGSHQKMRNWALSSASSMLSLAVWPWVGHFTSWAQFHHLLKKGKGLLAKTGSNGLSSCGCSMLSHPWTTLVLLPLGFAFHELLLFILSQICTSRKMNHSLKSV